MKKEDKIRIFEWLQVNNYLDYGKIIPTTVFEELFEFNIEDSWDFLGPYLEIKEFLEENGYLCTSSGTEKGSLRIYDCDEMSHRAEQITKNIFRKLRKLNKCMNKTRVEEFSSKDFKYHLHAKSKIQSIIRSLESTLLGEDNE